MASIGHSKNWWYCPSTSLERLLSYPFTFIQTIEKSEHAEQSKKFMKVGPLSASVPFASSSVSSSSSSSSLNGDIKKPEERVVVSPLSAESSIYDDPMTQPFHYDIREIIMNNTATTTAAAVAVKFDKYEPTSINDSGAAPTDISSASAASGGVAVAAAAATTVDTSSSSSSCFHEAGYDALCTGIIFVRLVEAWYHYNKYLKPANPSIIFPTGAHGVIHNFEDLLCSDIPLNQLNLMSSPFVMKLDSLNDPLTEAAQWKEKNGNNSGELKRKHHSL
jgi:hypothetical protein